MTRTRHSRCGITNVLLLLVLVSTALLSPTAAAADDCTLTCLHNTQCVTGTMNLTGLPLDPVTGQHYLTNETSRNGYHCACPPGLTGLRCGRQFDSCVAALNTGCFHGGSCLEGVADIFGNNQFFCDCSTATEISQEDQLEGVTHYVGRVCEFPVATQHYCSFSANSNDTIAANSTTFGFCINGGTCRTDTTHLHELQQRPCTCPSDTLGSHCEYKFDAVPNCTLDCHGRGTCQLGLKPELEQFGFASHVDYMHCECDAGFAGTQCQVVAVACHHDLICLHGSKCVTNNSTTGSHHCDCGAAKTAHNMTVAGKYCQFQATDHCHHPRTVNTTSSNNVTHVSNKGFCVNNGTCTRDGSTNVSYCNCHNTGFKGQHCETGSTPAQPDHNSMDRVPTRAPSPRQHAPRDPTPQTNKAATPAPTLATDPNRQHHNPHKSLTDPAPASSSSSSAISAPGKLGIVLLCLGTMVVTLLVYRRGGRRRQEEKMQRDLALSVKRDDTETTYPNDAMVITDLNMHDASDLNDVELI